MAEGIETADLGWGKAGEDNGCWGPGVGIDPTQLHSLPASQSHIMWPSQVMCFIQQVWSSLLSALLSPDSGHCHPP